MLGRLASAPGRKNPVNQGKIQFGSNMGSRCVSLVVFTALAFPLVQAAHGAAGVVIDINTQTSTPLPAGFSGVNVPQLRNGVEYSDPKFVAAAAPLKGGWFRFPAGTASMAYDWNAGHINTTWMNSLITGNPPLVSPSVVNILTASQQLTQAKGGVYLSDFSVFAKALGANAIICLNGFTDTNPGSSAQFAQAAQNLGLNVLEWELNNEPYLFPLIYPTATSYTSAMFNPYYTDVTSVAPTTTIGLFSAGLFPGTPANYSSWDNALAAYSPRYWNASSIHVYPITKIISTSDTVKTLNGVLAHGTADYINSYLIPLIGTNTPVFITELNCCTPAASKFLSYLYNGIFLAEYIIRMSAVPNVKAIGINSLYTDNYDYHGLIQSVNDYESYLYAQIAANPNFYTNTATDPNTQFQFYTSAPGLAVEVANQAMYNSTQIWPTTVTGGSTVPILGYDGLPIPAIYGQAYMGSAGNHYLVITNKASQAKLVTIRLNGVNVTGTLNVATVANASPSAANTAQAQNNVQIQTLTATNPLQVGSYSVTTVSW